MDIAHIVQLIQEVALAQELCVDTVTSQVCHSVSALPVTPCLRSYEHMSVRELKTRIFLHKGICVTEGTKLEHMHMYHKVRMQQGVSADYIADLLRKLDIRHLYQICTDLHMGNALPRTKEGLIREILLER